MTADNLTSNCRPGSAWHAWKKAGADWAAKTQSTSAGALLLAANVFASFSDSENERRAKKRAFAEGAKTLIEEE